MAPLAILDTDHLDRMTSGDKALQAEVLDLFRHQAELWGRLLDPQFPADNWGDAAHTLKGAARGIGAKKLADVCQEAESLGRAGGGGDGPASSVDRIVRLAVVREVLDETLAEVAHVRHALEIAMLRAPHKAAHG
jgi:HPt (histidine-containing phosphotransfer) domain-containing protein